MAAYGSPGRYKTGVWLVTLPDGSAGYYGRASLPKNGTQYYWLGTNYNNAMDSTVNDAIAKLGLNPDKLPNISQRQWQKLMTGTHGAVGKGAGVTPTNPSVAGPPIQAVKGAVGSIADAINSTVDFLKLIAWLFHPRNIIRAVEFLVGLTLMLFGFHAVMQARGEGLEGFTTSETALTRSGLARVASSLGAAARGEGGGKSGHRPTRTRSAPHVTRRRALAQRYTREERVRQRERKGEKPAGHAGATKGSGAGTKKTP